MFSYSFIRSNLNSSWYNVTEIKNKAVTKPVIIIIVIVVVLYFASGGKHEMRNM